MKCLLKFLSEMPMSPVRGNFSMVSPVQHPGTPNQAENVLNQAPAKAAQKPSVKPQPVQDSVTLSRTSDVDHDGDSK